ncbi:MAG: hypothetical protein HOK21_13870 [Rhodospirillaceae bacterium]|jgi:hypothetical protein|nr:hypothetical protein [Rhodospirillaceae bacterium]MBT5080750.1 hypothetical protein [Rhodospirillaceae bacterium]MBT5525172.1 hypothetical protein [Rhodospirillaceae bacterium]MBT5877741.1 hypothetical protein [Rhodospirillaceae bacterium]MBT6912008.1 hypothetical protein [Rhodospirillaceae bacterium]
MEIAAYLVSLSMFEGLSVSMQIENNENRPNLYKSKVPPTSTGTAKFELDPAKFAEPKTTSGGSQKAPPSLTAASAPLTTSDTKGRIPVNQLTAIDVSNLEPIAAPLDMVERLHKMLTRLFSVPNIPAEGTFAEVKVGGKVIAKILNSGGVETSNATNARMQKLFRHETADKFVGGPELAEERARKIAAAFGGTIERADTAQTQRQWQNRPPTTWSIDSTMMAQHGYQVPEDLINVQYATASQAADAITAFMNSEQP